MVSLIKTQWFRILVGVVCLIMACTYAFSPAPDESTIEGVVEGIGLLTSAFMWFIASISWFIMATVCYNNACIEKLNERVKALEEEKKNARATESR